MKRLALLVIAGLAALIALAAPAAAHVTVSAPDAAKGGYAVLTFRVPTESDTASTTKLVVQFPTATPLASVSVQPTPGWTTATRTSKLAKPITTDDGQVTSAVSQVTWTAASGSAIKPGEFQQFAVEAGPLPDAASVSFPAIQTYSDGTVVRWIEKQAPGSSAEPEHPAPTLQLTASASAVPSASPSVTAEPAAKAASTTGPTVLSIIALVVAALALGFAITTRARRSSS